MSADQTDSNDVDRMSVNPASSSSQGESSHTEEPPKLSRVQEARAKFAAKREANDDESSSNQASSSVGGSSASRRNIDRRASKLFNRPADAEGGKKPGFALKRRQTSEDVSGGIVDVGGRSYIGASVVGDGFVVNVQCLSSKDLGKFRIQPNTTFGELRAEIARKLGHSNFTFQDRETKRQWTDEAIPIWSVKAPILVSQSGLDNLLADTTFLDKKQVTVLPDGTTAFKLFWWDSLNHTRRVVWLKFEPHRISVTSAGGSFRLFDANGLRSSLKFASVRGSDKGFQFVKGRMASRFFASTVEQKNTLSIFFCFVWRPNAVRRGWLPPLEDPFMNEAVDTTDPRLFSNLLRKHLVEVDQIIKDVEKSADPRAVREYMKMFVQMFSGGYAINGANGEGGFLDRARGDANLSALGALRDHLALDHDVLQDGSEPMQARMLQKGKQRSGSAGELFETDGPSLAVSGDPNAPPPPPPPGGGAGAPPPPPLIMKPPICPVNFEGISAHDIPGTVWADLTADAYSFKSMQQEALTAQLKLIFGKEAREHTLAKDEDEEIGVLESGRLRNLEVLLNMEELKGLTYERIVDLIEAFDDSLFGSYSVLERLARRSNKAGGIQYAFLPTQKEAEALIEFAEQNGDEYLRPGEVFFLELAIRIPDRIQRFEFGAFMAKFNVELPGVKGELDIIAKTDAAIRSSDRFKRALKVILEILTTLMPRFGLTRGFRISSFLSSTERVNGSVANPSEGRIRPEDVMAAIEASIDPGLDEKERKKQIKLAVMRKKVLTTKEKDFWAVRLQEFISCFTTRFQNGDCEGFWEDLIEPCHEAMRVDQQTLDQQSGEWLLSLEELTEYYELAKSEAETGAFITALGDFVRTEGPKVTRIREEVLAAKRKTNDLWKWMGEVMGGDPSLIFKHIHDFSEAFSKHWKSLQDTWEQRKTMVLRGALPLEKYVPPPKSEKKKLDADRPKYATSRTMRSKSATIRPARIKSPGLEAAKPRLRADSKPEKSSPINTAPHTSSGSVSEMTVSATASEMASSAPSSDYTSSAPVKDETIPPSTPRLTAHTLTSGSTDVSEELAIAEKHSSSGKQSVSTSPTSTADETKLKRPRSKSSKSSKSSHSKSSSPEASHEILNGTETHEEDRPTHGRKRSMSHSDVPGTPVNPAKYPVPGKHTTDDSSPVATRKKPKSKLKKLIKMKF